MLHFLRCMLILVAIANTALARLSFEEECLNYLIDDEIISGGYLETYSRQGKVSLPQMRETFKGATLAFLNTWQANPFSGFPINVRLELAVFAVRGETGSLFNKTEKAALWWVLLNLTIAMRQENGRQARDFCIDVVACSVLQNIFPLALRNDPEANRFRAFSRRTIKRHRQQLHEAIATALRSHPLHLDRVEHRVELVKHLSQISCLRFGWTLLSNKMEAFIEEYLPRQTLHIPTLIEFARRTLSPQAIITALIAMYSPRQN